MRIPFFCSFIPVELLAASGHDVVDISLFENTKYSLAYSCSLHDNICSYAKYLFEKIVNADRPFDFVVVPKVCDAMKHLHSSLCRTGNIESFLLDVPGRAGDHSAKYLSAQYLALLKRISPDFAVKGEALCRPEQNHCRFAAAQLFAREGEETRTFKIGIAGSSFSPALFRDILKKYDAGSVFLRHCGHGVLPSGASRPNTRRTPEETLLTMARDSLQNTLCPRSDNGLMVRYILDEIRRRQLSGLIVTTLKFCDFYAFALEKLKTSLPDHFPCLYLENDLSVSSDEQNATRIEAFMERIASGKPAKKKVVIFKTAEADFYSIGLDVGSTTTKGVLLKDGKEILAEILIPTAINMKDSAEAALSGLLRQGALPEGKMIRTLYTGYGRTAFPDRLQATEITCHAVGVNFLTPQAGTVIDIGGQDSKAIRINESGNVLRFAMNDKCAAGTGRFLESMIQRMDISFDRFSALSLAAEEPTPISSMCSVFAESEVVSLMTKGIPVGNIARGLNLAIAERVCSLVRRIQGEAPFILTGGLSRNAGFASELEKALACSVTIFPKAQFAGAIGAAVLGSLRQDLRENDG